MDEHTGPKHAGNASRSSLSSTLATAGGVGTFLLLGAAAISLTKASPEALAATTSAALITGLACLVVMTYLVARRTLPGPDDGGGPDTPPPRPATVRPPGDPDAELLRILDDARLGELATPLARHRRPGSSGPATR